MQYGSEMSKTRQKSCKTFFPVFKTRKICLKIDNYDVQTICTNLEWFTRWQQIRRIVAVNNFPKPSFTSLNLRYNQIRTSLNFTKQSNDQNRKQKLRRSTDFTTHHQAFFSSPVSGTLLKGKSSFKTKSFGEPIFRVQNCSLNLSKDQNHFLKKICVTFTLKYSKTLAKRRALSNKRLHSTGIPHFYS